MKKTLLIVGVLVVGAIISLQTIVPLTINAAPTGINNNGAQGSDSNGAQRSGQVTIDNPLQVDSIQELIAEALKFVVELLAIAGVMYIIWTGFKFVAAQGNPKELEAAKKSFVNAIIGMAIILGAWAIATAIANTINQITGNDDATLMPIR